MAELRRHWLKGSDGWTTAIVSGSPYAPDHFLRQCRALTIKEMVPQDLSESDKLNGFEWVGRANSSPRPAAKAAGRPGMVLDGMSNVVVSKQAGQWSQWVDFTPGPLRFARRKAGGNSIGMPPICVARFPDRKISRTQACSRRIRRAEHEMVRQLNARLCSWLLPIYSAALAASASTTAIFGSNSCGMPCRCCKYAGLL